MSESPDNLEHKKSFISHLIELRACLIKAFVSWVIASILVYLKIESTIAFLLKPLYKNLPLEEVIFFKTFTEVFSLYIKIAIIGGFILGSPYIFYQLWNFVAPGLYSHEKKWIKIAFLLTCFAFLFGTLLAYFAFIPFIIKILSSFGKNFLTFKPFLNEYISFVLKIFILFGIVFQLPSFIFFLFFLQLINSRFLKTYRGYFIIFFFLISAIVTSSSDPLNQILLGILLTILYEISIICIKIIEFRRNL